MLLYKIPEHVLCTQHTSYCLHLMWSFKKFFYFICLTLGSRSTCQTQVQKRKFPFPGFLPFLHLSFLLLCLSNSKYETDRLPTCINEMAWLSHLLLASFRIRHYSALAAFCYCFFLDDSIAGVIHQEPLSFVAPNLQFACHFISRG